MMKLSIVLFVVLCYVGTSVGVSLKRRSLLGGGKSGSCPLHTGAGICVEECSRDKECPGREKCCSNGCGHVCMAPAKRRREPVFCLHCCGAPPCCNYCGLSPIEKASAS